MMQWRRAFRGRAAALREAAMLEVIRNEWICCERPDIVSFSGGDPVLKRYPYGCRNCRWEWWLEWHALTAAWETEPSRPAIRPPRSSVHDLLHEEI